jgi:hypothetical protein
MVMKERLSWYLLTSVWLVIVFWWGYVLGISSWFGLQTWSFGVWAAYMSLILPCVFCAGYNLRLRGLLLEYLEEEPTSVWLGRSVVVTGAFGGMILALLVQNFLVLWWMCVLLVAIFFLKVKWWNYVPVMAIVFLIGQQLALKDLWLTSMWLPLIFVSFTSLVLMWARTVKWLGWIVVINICYVIWEVGSKMARLL